MSNALTLDTSIASSYKSNSQKARVMTEHWVSKNMYCPSCESPYLEALPNNAPVADFICRQCGEEFELKASQKRMTGTVADGAYTAMMKRLQDDSNPNLILLRYENITSQVRDIIVVPKYYFTPNVIIQRPPLTAHARRAGWVGCNIHVAGIADIGKIRIIGNNNIKPAKEVAMIWHRSVSLLKENSMEERVWINEVAKRVERIDSDEFTLADMYQYQEELSRLFPDNNNVQAKIRQQLQLLRDGGIIEFIARGKYKKL